MTKTRVHFLLGFQNLAVDVVKLSNAGEAFLIRCFMVTDIFQSTDVISAIPELKLGQHLVHESIVRVKYSGAILLSAAFLIAHVHLQGLS